MQSQQQASRKRGQQGIPVGINLVLVSTSLHSTICVVAGCQTQGFYLLPRDGKRFVDVRCSCTVFAVHASQPYIRQCFTTPYTSLKDLQAGQTFGWPAFLTTTKKAFPAEYMGPFILGICWQPWKSTHSSLQFTPGILVMLEVAESQDVILLQDELLLAE